MRPQPTGWAPGAEASTGRGIVGCGASGAFKLFKIKPWRKTPFLSGRRCRVLKDFERSCGGPFRAGEVMMLRGYDHSLHDGLDGYESIQDGPAPRRRRQEISVHENLAVWSALFESMPREQAMVALLACAGVDGPLAARGRLGRLAMGH